MGERTMSEKQKRKRNRTRMYFLQAAKDIITSEGVESVSVRRVAEIAGYSYPTLYSYFADLNELLWETKQYMILDFVEDMRQRMDYSIEDKEGVRKVFKTYMEYYLENPTVFRFFYFYSVQRPSGKTDDVLVEPDFGAMWKETFQCFVANGRLRDEDIEAVAKIFIYAMHGMLALSFSNNGDLGDKANLYRDLDQMVDYLL